MSEASKLDEQESAADPNLYYNTNAPEIISEELLPVIEKLGLVDHCRQLATNGYTVIENVASPEFNETFRNKILEMSSTGDQPMNMLLREDPIFCEAVLNPKLMAMAEFSVGKGFLISQVAASVRPAGSPAMALHADSNWMPAPFPVHNMLLTACWACDDFTKENGATMVIPGSQTLRRHPNKQETEALAGAIAIECPAGSVAMWDGNIWHGNWARKAAGERVVSHITYTRLMCRQVEDYSADADRLIEMYGQPMAQLMGREDSLFGSNGFLYEHLYQTFNNAKR